MIAGALLSVLAVLAQPAASVPSAAEAERSIDARAFTWQVEPTPVVLGQTASATLTLRAKARDGAPLDVGTPRVSASVGTVSEAERIAPGTWRVAFTPPRETFPHIAIVVATLDVGTAWAVGFLPLSLWGQGQTIVRTKPASQVSLRVPTSTGTQMFGPVTADDKGAAVVPVIVPPGAGHGIARSRDEAGNESEAPIDLGVPPFQRVALAVVDDVVAGDGSGFARLLAVAVDERGAPLTRPELQVNATVGTVSSTSVAPGVTLVVLRPGKTRAAHADVEVTLAAAAGSRARARVVFAPGRVAAAAITLSRDALTADDLNRALDVSVLLVDEAGRPAGLHTVGVTVDVGRVSALVPSEGGARALTWTLPDASRVTKATMTVRLPSHEVMGTADLELRRGMPVSMAFDPRTPIVADGATPIELVLRATDRSALEVAPTGARFKIDPAHGRVLDVRVEGLALRVPVLLTEAEERRTVAVRATVGDVVAEAQLKVLPRPRVIALVAPGLVVASNYQAIVAVGPDLSFLTTLPLLDGTVVAGGSLALLQSLTRPAGIADHRALPAFAELGWRPPSSIAGVDFHLGAAAGVALVDLVRVGQSAHVLEPVIVAQGVLGFVVPAGPGAVEVMARVGSSIFLDDDSLADDAGLPLGAGLALSYRFALF